MFRELNILIHACFYFCQAIMESHKNQTLNALMHQILSRSFFERPAELVAPDLIGCILVKREKGQKLLWGVIVETEAYSQNEPACHGYKRRTSSNETLFGPPGNLYIYLTYGIHHCINIVTGSDNWANGVLLRAIALPNETERIAAGPGLLAKRFDLDISYDNLSVTGENNVWVVSKPSTTNKQKIVNSTRIGISAAKNLKWRWYLKASRSISKRETGDPLPPVESAWFPEVTYPI